MDAGTFRRDLLFRINSFVIELPPLRERVDEVRGLAAQFIAACGPAGGPRPALSSSAARMLEQQPWPGNIRELRNTIERAVLVVGDGPIEIHHLQLGKRVSGMTASVVAPAPAALSVALPAAASVDALDNTTELRKKLQVAERERIVAALTECGGNQTRAAAVLGISRRTLVTRLKDLDLPRPRTRTPREIDDPTIVSSAAPAWRPRAS